MKYVLIVLLGFISVSCAQPAVNVVDIAADFKPYVDEFQQAGNLTITNLIIKFGDTSKIPNDQSGTTVGYCQLGSVPTITVSTDFWNNLSQGVRRELLFHEMGHCVLGLDHITARLPNGAYASIMYPQVFNADANLQYYKNELFSH